MELLRDPIRLAFAFFGPLILMFAFGYGISLDVEHCASPPSTGRDAREPALLDAFSTIPRYFVGTAADPSRRSSSSSGLRSGETQIAVEIPPGFGRDLDQRPHA